MIFTIFWYNQIKLPRLAFLSGFWSHQINEPLTPDIVNFFRMFFGFFVFLFFVFNPMLENHSGGKAYLSLSFASIRWLILIFIYFRVARN